MYEPQKGDFIKIIQPEIKIEGFYSQSYKREFTGIFYGYFTVERNEKLAVVYVVLTDENVLVCSDFEKRQLFAFDKRHPIVKATEKEKQLLVNALKIRGKEWDAKNMRIKDI